MAMAHNRPFVDSSYRSPLDEAAWGAAKDSCIANLQMFNAIELTRITKEYGKEFLTFSHMHEKDELRRDKLAYEAAYRDVCTFYHPDFNQRIVLTLNEAVGLSADVELIRNAAIEWVKAQ